MSDHSERLNIGKRFAKAAQSAVGRMLEGRKVMFSALLATNLAMTAMMPGTSPRVRDAINASFDVMSATTQPVTSTQVAQRPGFTNVVAIGAPTLRR